MPTLTKTIFGALLASAGLAAVPAAADQLVYHNARFGFQITLPSEVPAKDDTARQIDWHAAFSDTATDGAQFEAEQGKIKLVTYASLFWQDDWQQVYRDAADFIKREGGEITYQKVTDSWFAYSGYTADGDVFYRRTERALNCLQDDTTITAELTYASSERWIENAIGPMMSSLKGC